MQVLRADSRALSSCGLQTEKSISLKKACKVLLCVGVGLIKKTLAWQQISYISHSVKIEKYLKIEPFTAVTIRNLVCCIVFFINRRIFLHFATCSSTAVTLRYISSFLWILALLLIRSIIFQRSAMILICDLEHDRIAATFTRMFTPKPSACVPNMVIGRARRPSGWDTW